MDDSTKQKFEGKFDQIKGRLKEKYGQVTDDDLKQTEGNYDRVIGVIKERTGKAREEVEKEVDNLSNDTLGQRTKRD